MSNTASSGKPKPRLFQPWSIGALTLENRIVIPPLCMYQAKHGKMGSFHAMHVGCMCTSGAGLVILEASSVNPEGRITNRCCGIWDDETAAAMKAVLDGVREYSATPMAIQLHHAGRKACVRTPKEESWQPVGPSALKFAPSDVTPRALCKEEMMTIKQDFVDAAIRSADMGLAGIELHFAHGYLMHQFLSPLSNVRTDEYGGSLENRMRFPLEVFEAVQNAMSPRNVPVWARVSATEWSDERETFHPQLAVVESEKKELNPPGWNAEEALVFCKKLKELGCAIISVSTGGNLAEQHIPPLHSGYQMPFAQRIRLEVGIQTIGVGLITTPLEAELALQVRACDAVAVGRAMLFNPRWGFQAAHELGSGATIKGVVESYQRSEPKPLQGIFE